MQRRRRPRRRPSSARGRRPGRRAPGAAPRWSAWPWPSTTRVMPPSCAPPRRRRFVIDADAGVEDEDAVAVAHEVDVHRLAREAAADDPHAVGDLLRAARAWPRASRVFGVEGLVIALLGRASPAAGSTPSCGRSSSRRCRRRSRRSAPSWTTSTSTPSSVEPRAVGLEPLERAGPANVPVAAQRTAARLVLDGDGDDLAARSRGTRRTAREVLADAVGRRRASIWPWMSVAPARRPAGRRPRRGPGARRPRSSARDLSAVVVFGAAAAVDMRRDYRAAPDAACHAPASASSAAASACCPASGGCGCRCPGPGSRTATPGRSRRATASCSSTRACTSRARSPTSSARSTRSTCKVEHVRLLVCTHAHSDHYGQAAHDHRARGVRAVDAPQPPAHDRRRRRIPDAALERRLEVARQCGVPERAAAALRARRARASGFGIARHRRARSRPAAEGVTIDTDLGAWQVVRDARPRAVARLPLPARAPRC